MCFSTVKMSNSKAQGLKTKKGKKIRKIRWSKDPKPPSKDSYSSSTNSRMMGNYHVRLGRRRGASRTLLSFNTRRYTTISGNNGSLVEFFNYFTTSSRTSTLFHRSVESLFSKSRYIQSYFWNITRCW